MTARDHPNTIDQRLGTVVRVADIFRLFGRQRLYLTSRLGPFIAPGHNGDGKSVVVRILQLCAQFLCLGIDFRC